VKRFVLSYIREAKKPVTSRDITEAWALDRGLVCDETTFTILRKRIGACIKVCLNQGLLVNHGWTQDHGESRPYQLWSLKKSGMLHTVYNQQVR